MTDLLAQLLSRRLLLVTGKGGTGKTSVAAALGRLAADRGVRTLVVELGHAPVLPRAARCSAAAREAATPLRDPLAAGPNLFTLRLVPEEALLEYLELQLRVRRLARAIVGNAGFRRFLEAAPGWRELITLGKLWHMVTREDAHGTAALAADRDRRARDRARTVAALDPDRDPRHRPARSAAPQHRSGSGAAHRRVAHAGADGDAARGAAR